MLPYDDSNFEDSLITRIREGKRPSRPTEPSQNQWLQDPVWDVITTGWRDKPEQRCELSVVSHVFSAASHQEIQNDELGELTNTRERKPSDS